MTRTILGLGLAAAVVLAGCDPGQGPIQTKRQAEFLFDGEFGRVEVGTISSAPVTARSLGPNNVTIREVRITGENAAWLKAEGQGKTIALRSELPLTFQPLGVGTMNATVEFVTDEPEDRNVHSLTVTGIGFVPAVTVEPTQLKFANVVLGSERTLTVQLTNGGDDIAAIGVAAVNSKTPEVFTVTLPAGSAAGSFKLDPGEVKEIAVTYHPELAGNHQGSFSVSPCDACGKKSVILSGQGIESGLLVEPTEVSYGEVNPGSQVCRDVTFSNIGNLRIQLTRLSIVPSQAGQELDSTFSLDAVEMPVSLDEGDAFPATVCFAPKDTRWHTAKISYASTDQQNSSGEVFLYGTGGGPDIALQPTQLNYGQVSMSAPMTREVTVLNQGYADLSVTAVEVVGDAFELLEDPSPVTVPVGERLVLSVRYAPTAEQDDTGELRVTSNDADTPVAVATLSGTGVDVPPCQFEVLPGGPLTFPNVKTNRKYVRDFAIINRNASEECLVSAIGLTPDSDPAFTIETEVTENIRIPAGDKYEVEVGFQPTETGQFRGGVKFYISNPDTPEVIVPLSGSSKDWSISIAPDDFDFGVVKVGCATKEQDFCVYNSGATAVTFQGVELEESGEDGEFHLVNVPMAGTSIASGDRLCFKVSYRAVDLGRDNAALKVKLDISPDPFLVLLMGEGATDATQTDTFTQLDKPQADILFVIDNSGSMYEEQQALANNFQSFIEFAVQEDIDYHLAITDTDCDDDALCGVFVPKEGPASERIVHPNLPDPEGLFMQNVLSLGTNGSYSEKAFKAGFTALQPDRLNGPNAGFLRREAYLAVVFVTDEPEQSDKTVDFYLSSFLNIKGFRQREFFMVGAICGDDPGGCRGPGGSASAAPRIIDMANRAGGTFESICTDNWSDSLANMARIAFGKKTRFFLKSPPVAGTIEVQLVDEAGNVYDATGTWTYDAASQAIDFSPFHVPEPGDTIEITYEVQCI